jgi:ligand-binding SRPBCC domain-containing protein
VELVFAFFANPHNLPRLMPPRLAARIEDARLCPPPGHPEYISSVTFAGEGSEILIGFRPIPWLPMRVRWLARITAFAWNSHFCDEQVRGPFAAFRHRHGIEAEVREGANGTLVSDEIDYALPFGILGRIAVPFVRGQLRQSFAYRQQRLLDLLELALRSAAQPQ